MRGLGAFTLLLPCLALSLLASGVHSADINVCDFYSGWCDWTPLAGRMDWMVSSSPTPTANTGPSGDHTTGSGSFVYLKSTSVAHGMQNGVLYLNLNVMPELLNAGETEACLQFWYNMNGANINYLNVLNLDNTPGLIAEELSTNPTPVFGTMGNQGDVWKQAIVPLSTASNSKAMTVAFKVTLVSDTTSLGDVALDDIKLSAGACPAATTTTSTTAAPVPTTPSPTSAATTTNTPAPTSTTPRSASTSTASSSQAPGPIPVATTPAAGTSAASTTPGAATQPSTQAFGAPPSGSTPAPGGTTQGSGPTTQGSGATTQSSGASTAGGPPATGMVSTTPSPSASGGTTPTSSGTGATTPSSGTGATTPSSGTGATTVAPGATTPLGAAGGSTSQAQGTTRPPSSAPGASTSSPPAPYPTVTAVRNQRFSCVRPTSPCYRVGGQCNPNTGTCLCRPGFYGLRCQVPPLFPADSGVCARANHCERGTCFDYRGNARCACPDGYYGNRCQHKMVHVECHRNGMLLNVLPYGYSPRYWSYLTPPSLSNCRMPPNAVFVSRWPQFATKGWSGFTGAFYHANDRCAGNAMITETAQGTQYSRTLRVFYGRYGRRHFSDVTVRVTCTVPKQSTLQAAPAQLPAPRVTYSLLDQAGQPVSGSVQRGQNVGISFKVGPQPNNAGVTNLRIEACFITNGQTTIPIAQEGCPRAPIGVRVTRAGPGQRVLWISTLAVPGGSPGGWRFQCRVRTCTDTDLTCSASTNCGTATTARRRRSASLRYDVSDNFIEEVTSADFVIKP